MTIADLQALAAWLTKLKKPAKAAVATWGVAQLETLTNWQTTAKDQLMQLQIANTQLNQQLATDQSTISSLQAQIAALQAQLAAGPGSLVLVSTHLHGFKTDADAAAFLQAGGYQSPIKFDSTDYTWHP